jgi:hypothetical protein
MFPEISSGAGLHKFSKKSTSHLKILGARRVIGSKFHTVYLPILGAIVWNLVAPVNWRREFVHPWSVEWVAQRKLSWSREWISGPFLQSTAHPSDSGMWKHDKGHDVQIINKRKVAWIEREVKEGTRKVWNESEREFFIDLILLAALRHGSTQASDRNEYQGY